MRFQGLSLAAALCVFAASCQTTEVDGVRRSGAPGYYGYSLQPTQAFAPYKRPRGHSYYYASRDARSPYRDYLQYVSDVRSGLRPSGSTGGFYPRHVHSNWGHGYYQPPPPASGVHPRR